VRGGRHRRPTQFSLFKKSRPMRQERNTAATGIFPSSEYLLPTANTPGCSYGHSNLLKRQYADFRPGRNHREYLQNRFGQHLPTRTYPGLRPGLPDSCQKSSYAQGKAVVFYHGGVPYEAQTAKEHSRSRHCFGRLSVVGMLVASWEGATPVAATCIFANPRVAAAATGDFPGGP
jgi:hypothetical protein